MIKVNLVPEEHRKKVREVKFKKPALRIPKLDMVFSVIVLLAVIVGFFVWNLTLDKTLRDYDYKIAEDQRKLKELEKEKKMVEDLENRQRELKEWISLVQNLNKGRALYFHVMDEVNKLKPEYLWITLFEENNQKFKLDGKTFSNYMISNFMDRLSSSSYFSGIKLDEIKETQEKDYSVVGFRLSGSIKLGGE